MTLQYDRLISLQNRLLVLSDRLRSFANVEVEGEIYVHVKKDFNYETDAKTEQALQRFINNLDKQITKLEGTIL